MTRKRHKKKQLKLSVNGSNGDFELIEVDALRIDPMYQRGEVSERELRRIINAFNWKAFGTLSVMRRASGALFVVDGQQRLRAAKRLNIKRVPCLIYDSHGSRDEAKRFIQHNTQRVSVTAIDKFNAAVRANFEPESTINKWLESQGITVTKQYVQNALAYPGQLVRLWQRDSEACKRAILAQLSLKESDPLMNAIDAGLWWLEHGGVDTSKHIQKLRKLGGKVALCQAISKLKIALHGGGTPSEKIAGLAILQLINRGKRNRVGTHLITPE